MEREKIRKIAKQEKRKDLLKKGLISIAVLLILGIPAMADINVKDEGDLVVHGQTNLNMTDSPIKNVGAPEGPHSVVNKEWVLEQLDESFNS